MLAGIVASLAEDRRELAHERTAARVRGRHAGRPPRSTPAQTRQVRALRDGGKFIADLVISFSHASINRDLAARETCPWQQQATLRHPDLSRWCGDPLSAPSGANPRNNIGGSRLSQVVEQLRSPCVVNAFSPGPEPVLPPGTR